MWKRQQGFSLVESIAAIAIFAIILAGVLGLFSILTTAVKSAREQTVLTALAASQLEIAKNLPFDEIGTLNGNPVGNLPDFVAPQTLTFEGKDYQIYFEVTYIDDPADGTILAGTDVAANDYKQVKMYIKNLTNDKITSFITNISPKGLEGLINAGALLLKVFDANGQPIANASVNIQNASLGLNLNRQTDAQGNWVEVGLPAAVNGYHVSATKVGYTTDQTYPITVANPNPVKPDATIVTGQVTQISFSIDVTSALTIRTLNQTCQSLSGVDMNVRGSKLIGTSPDVYKYNQNSTSAGGSIIFSSIEWDNYTPTLLTGQNLTVYGSSPIQQVNVLPGASQIFTLILGPQTANSLLVIVKDGASGAALQNAVVTLTQNVPFSQDTKITGGSVWVQNDWAGGAGQSDFVSPSRYFADDGNIDANGIPSGVRLVQLGGNYVASGSLVSSTFDTGGSSTFTTISWDPSSQSPNTALKFQVASNNDNATWNFIGPDGTNATYYSVPGTSLHSSHNGDQYIRYQAFLETTDPSTTPVLTSFVLNYVSGCFTPGQAIFPGLSAGNNYDLSVILTGYQNFNLSGLNISGNQVLEVLLTP